MIATRLQVAAYIGQSLTSRAIQWFTRAGWDGPSHVAIRDSQTGQVYEAWEGAGVRVLDHLGQGHSPGTVVHLYNWLLDDDDVASVTAFCRSQIGKKYDLRGALGFITRKRRDNADRWFCSELVTAAASLTKAPILERVPPHHVAPIHVAWSPTLWYHSTVCTHNMGHIELPHAEPYYGWRAVRRFAGAATLPSTEKPTRFAP